MLDTQVYLLPASRVFLTRRHRSVKTGGASSPNTKGLRCMTLPRIDTDRLLDFLVRLLNTPSPTGFAEPAIELVE